MNENDLAVDAPLELGVRPHRVELIGWAVSKNGVAFSYDASDELEPDNVSGMLQAARESERAALLRGAALENYAMFEAKAESDCRMMG